MYFFETTLKIVVIISLLKTVSLDILSKWSNATQQLMRHMILRSVY